MLHHGFQRLPRPHRILSHCSALALLGGLSAAQVSGTVVDSSTLAPIPGALVTLQTTDEQTVAAADGSFFLPNVSGSNLVIVAAKETFFNGSVVVTTPATAVTIALDAVPQQDNTAYNFVAPSSCGLCHSDQLADWTDSPMAKAGENTWVYDIYNGTGSSGGLGGFVYTRDSVHAASNPESECAACHQPEPWITSPFNAMDDINNLSIGALHGISCEVCHKVAQMDETKLNFPGIWPDTVTFTRPLPGFDQVMYGVLGDTDFHAPGLMRTSYQPQLVSETCAACHQDKNDHDEDGDFEDAGGIVSEPTYFEWANSPYGDPTSDFAASCVDCHMPPSGQTRACTILSLVRDPQTIRSHRIEGTTPEFLENAVDLEVRLSRDATTLTVDVDVINSLTGHHVPTGVTVRNMILLVEATRDSDGLELTHTGTQVIDDLGGVGDPTLGYFAGLPGKLFAKLIEDAGGNAPTFFTDAVAIRFDTRIPALATDSTQYTFDLPPGTENVSVRARLIYRRAFRVLVDAKAWTTDGHGNPLEDLAAPHYGHLMEEFNGWSVPGVDPFGCGVNPSGSLSILSGTPTLGDTLEFGVDNPLGTQSAGAFSYLGISSAPDPNFPCGSPFPGWGMAGPGADGEFLISFNFPDPFVLQAGPPWLGPGSPASIPVPIPNNLALVGLTFYAQGLLIDPGASFGVQFGLTDALALTAGL